MVDPSWVSEYNATPRGVGQKGKIKLMTRLAGRAVALNYNLTVNELVDVFLAIDLRCGGHYATAERWRMEHEAGNAIIHVMS